MSLQCDDNRAIKLFDSQAPINFWCYTANSIQEAGLTVQWDFWKDSQKVKQGDFIFTTIVEDGKAPVGAFICAVSATTPVVPSES